MRQAVMVLGWGLVGLSGVAWAALLVVPWLPTDAARKAAIAGALLVGAEIVFWLGALLLGPEAVRRFRHWQRRDEPPG